MIEITGICKECSEEDILNCRGGICFSCWSAIDLDQHEKLLEEE